MDERGFQISAESLPVGRLPPVDLDEADETDAIEIMRSKRSVLHVLLLLMITVGALACDFPAQRQNAATTGPLVILGTAEEEYVRGMARAFELETGIRTTYVRLSAGEALVQLRAESTAPRFSVWWGGGADGYIAAAGEGLLEPYRPRGAAKIPRQYKDENAHWTGVYVGALGLAVNQRVLAERGLPEPTSWADLIDPVYRGQIAIAHPSTSGTAYTALATIMQLHDRDFDRGFTFVEGLHANVRQYSRAGAAPARLAGHGDVAIGIAFSHDIVAAIEDGDSDLTIVFPSEGTGYEIGAMALVRNAPNPAAGQRFMDWALSEKAQELGPLFSAYQIPTNPDAKVPEKSVRLSAVKTIAFDFRWSGENRQPLIGRFSDTIAAPPGTDA
jgi:iron(III) transport system substrate-binding protein